MKKTLEMDPNFARTYTDLADTWLMSGAVWGIKDQRTAWSKAKKLLNKALELDPNNRFAYDGLASGYHLYEWDFKQADDYFNLLKEMTGIEGDCWAPDFYLKMGSFERALVIDHLGGTTKKVMDDYKNEIFKTYQRYTCKYYGITMQNIEEAINFNNYHEGFHFGIMSAMKSSLR